MSRGAPALTAVVVLAALACCGCGAHPPQPPRGVATRLGVATGAISTACGEADQVTAFPGRHRSALATLEATASTAARKLAQVDRRNASWIYLGEPVRRVVADSASMLAACGLFGARRTLLRAGSGSATRSDGGEARLRR